MALTEHWETVDGVVHVIGRHVSGSMTGHSSYGRSVYTECVEYITTLEQKNREPLKFFQGNTRKEVTCLMCLVMSSWETYSR